VYGDTGKISAHLDIPKWYFLHRAFCWTENQENCCGEMARWIGLIFCIQGLFIMFNHPEKFQPKKIKGESTSFANWKSGQNLQMDVVLKI
jgi:hypothetical protein